VVIDSYGRDAVMEIWARLRELWQKKIVVVNVYLDFSDPLTSSVTGQLEKRGFFFAGLLPGGLPGTDALILQYLNNVPVDYDEIRMASDMAQELVSYVRNLDLNLQ
jgi:serine/threonine-protein kinase RsbW